MQRRLLLLLPLFLFTVVALFLMRGLQLDPSELPSALIDKPMPQFKLQDLKDEARMLTNADLTGRVALLNVWATWCPSCRVEHPYLVQLAEAGVAIYGLNYKDEDDAALGWLESLGDPYVLNIADRQGTLGLDLGVYGAPETYLLDAQGVVRYRHVGVVDDRVWSEILQPLYRQYGAGKTGAIDAGGGL